MGPERIDVVIHPESVVHSLVEYIDGSVMAQLGNPTCARHRFCPGLSGADYRGRRISRPGACRALHFERPDTQRFPCLRLAYEALKAGGTRAYRAHAANEVAVASFSGGCAWIPPDSDIDRGGAGRSSPRTGIESRRRARRRSHGARASRLLAACCAFQWRGETPASGCELMICATTGQETAGS